MEGHAPSGPFVIPAQAGIQQKEGLVCSAEGRLYLSPFCDVCFELFVMSYLRNCQIQLEGQSPPKADHGPCVIPTEGCEAAEAEGSILFCLLTFV
jgi:hypothetical protein